MDRGGASRKRKADPREALLYQSAEPTRQTPSSPDTTIATVSGDVRNKRLRFPDKGTAFKSKPGLPPFLSLPGEIRNHIYEYVLSLQGPLFCRLDRQDDLKSLPKIPPPPVSVWDQGKAITGTLSHENSPSISSSMTSSMKGQEGFQWPRSQFNYRAELVANTGDRRPFNQLKYVCCQMYSEVTDLEVKFNRDITFETALRLPPEVLEPGIPQLCFRFIGSIRQNSLPWLRTVRISFPPDAFDTQYAKGFPKWGEILDLFDGSSWDAWHHCNNRLLLDLCHTYPQTTFQITAINFCCNLDFQEGLAFDIYFRGGQLWKYLTSNIPLHNHGFYQSLEGIQKMIDMWQAKDGAEDAKSKVPQNLRLIPHVLGSEPLFRGMFNSLSISHTLTDEEVECWRYCVKEWATNGI